MAIISDELSRLVRALRSKQIEVDSCSGTNHEIFAEIFNLLQPLVKEYGYRLTGDRDLAEDLASEALMKLYQNVCSIDPDKTLSWTMKVAFNLFRSLWRKERRFCNIEFVPEGDLASRSRGVFADFHSDRVLERVAVQRALADLPSFEKNIIKELSRGHSVVEVARHCGKHRVTIYRHIDSIKRKLVQRLGGETIGAFRVPTVS